MCACVCVCVARAFLSFYLYDVLHYVTFLLSAIEFVCSQRGERAEMLHVYTCVKLTFHLADHLLRFHVPEPIEKFYVQVFYSPLSPAVSEFVIRAAVHSVFLLLAISSHLLNNVGLPQDR